MIQKVIYRRKAESLAPGRSGCLITFFGLGGWGWGGDEWGGSRGSTFTPSPSRPCPHSCPRSKQCPLFFLLPEKEFPIVNASLGQESRKNFWGWRRGRKREEARVPSPGTPPGSLAYRGGWERGPPWGGSLPLSPASGQVNS